MHGLLRSSRVRNLIRVFLCFVIFCCGLSRAEAERTIEFAKQAYAGQSFRVVRPHRLGELQLFWRQRGTERYRTLKGLEAALSARGVTLHFATNAGIFEPDFTPTGLHIEANRVLHPLNLQQGVGNFYLKPNGVFAVSTEGVAEIMPSRAARGQEHRYRIALQSGPLLLVDGAINPAFDPNSRNLAIRSAIGIDSERRVVIVLSREPVNFYTLANFLRESEGAQAALYLDGAISEFHVPAEGIVDSAREFGGMIGVVTE